MASAFARLKTCSELKLFALQTYIGPILIAVNPYKALPIFSPAFVDSYFARSAGDVRLPCPVAFASVRCVSIGLGRWL